MKAQKLSIFVIIMVLLFSLPALTADENEMPGKKIFLKFKCNSCHTVINESITKKASKKKKKKKKKKGPKTPDLSGTGAKRDMEWLIGYQKKKIKIKGIKHAKKFKGNNDELKAISAWLLSLKEAPKEATK